MQPTVQPQPVPQPAQSVSTQPTVQPQPVPQPAQSVSTQPTVQLKESNNRQEINHLIQSIEQCYNYIKEVDINKELLAEFDEINKYIETQKSNMDKNRPTENE
jgi:hypothetical protein